MAKKEDYTINIHWNSLPNNHAEIMRDIFENGEDPSWLNKYSYLTKKTFNLKTIEGRNQYDSFKDYYQRKRDFVTYYLNPQNKMNEVYGEMLNWAEADSASMLVIASNAGTGKTYGWKKIVAPYLNLPELKDLKDVNNEDWAYVMLNDKDACNIIQFEKTLVKYNSCWFDSNGDPKPRILFFEDADNMIASKSHDFIKLLKSLTEYQVENRLFTNPYTGKHEVWRGKIIITTNKDLTEFTHNDVFKEFIGRTTNCNIQLTKNETLELISERYKTIEFNDNCKQTLDSFNYSKEDVKLFREDVFDYLTKNIDKADPQKFTPQTYSLLCEYFATFWKSDKSILSKGIETIDVI